MIPMIAALTPLSRPQLTLDKAKAVARAGDAAGDAAAEDRLGPKGTAHRPGANPRGRADSSTRRKVV